MDLKGVNCAKERNIQQNVVWSHYPIPWKSSTIHTRPPHTSFVCFSRCARCHLQFIYLCENVVAMTYAKLHVGREYVRLLSSCCVVGWVADKVTDWFDVHEHNALVKLWDIPSTKSYDHHTKRVHSGCFPSVFDNVKSRTAEWCGAWTQNVQSPQAAGHVHK